MPPGVNTLRNRSGAADGGEVWTVPGVTAAKAAGPDRRLAVVEDQPELALDHVEALHGVQVAVRRRVREVAADLDLEHADLVDAELDRRRRLAELEPLALTGAEHDHAVRREPAALRQVVLVELGEVAAQIALEAEPGGVQVEEARLAGPGL